MSDDVKAVLAKLGGSKKKKAKGLPARTGRRKAKYLLYFNAVYARRKLRHMLRRNGESFARQWAKERGHLSLFQELTGRKIA